MTLTMLRVAQEMLGRTYVRYGLASAIALACDVCLFLLCLRTGLAPAYAAAIGYGFGTLVHWLISSRLVFTDRPDRGGAAAYRQKALFVASSLSGLLITMAIVALANMAGLLPIIGKLLAITISFQTTYLLRKMVIFT